MTYTHCICCCQPFSSENVFTREGKAETQISGICEACFDDNFGIYEEQDEDDF